MKYLREAELLQEATHLLLLLRKLGELLLDDLLKDTFKLVLKYADGGWDDVAQFLIELWLDVELFVHLEQVHKVLRVGLRQLGRWDVAFVVDLLVLIDSLG